MISDNKDPPLLMDKGSWWLNIKRSERIIAAVADAAVADVFVVITAIINHPSSSPNNQLYT